MQDGAKKYDVIVAGAGPAGSHCAAMLAGHGCRVLVAEEHSEIGRPVQCAGLVSPRVVESAPHARPSIIGPVRGGWVHSPLDRVLALNSGDTKAFVVDRARFDREMARHAASKGAEFSIRTRVEAVKVVPDGVDVSVIRAGRPETLRARAVVGADGPNSAVRRSLGLDGPSTYIRCVGAEFMGERPEEPDMLHIFTGSAIAPGFFAWAIPTDTGYRVGLGVDEPGANAGRCWKNLMSSPRFRTVAGKRHPGVLIAGTIPIGNPRRICTDRALLIGDAACQVKPTSGGGLFAGLSGAELAAKTLNPALEDDELDAYRMVQYQDEYAKTTGRIIRRCMRLNRAFMHLSDEKLEDGFSIIDRSEIIPHILEGDIDHPYRMASQVIRRAPALIKFAGPYIRSFFEVQ